MVNHSSSQFFFDRAFITYSNEVKYQITYLMQRLFIYIEKLGVNYFNK